MSRTNPEQRKKDNPHSFYPTGAKVTRSLLRNVDLPWHGRWIEPCAGDGAIISAANDYWNSTVYPCSVEWSAVELQPKFKKPLSALVPAKRLHIGDALAYFKRTRTDFDVGITNPAFPLAEALYVAMRPKTEYLILLLRVGFLEAKSRLKLFGVDTPDVYLLSPRPGFEKGGNDSASYAWCVWGPKRQRHGRFQIISTVEAK